MKIKDTCNIGHGHIEYQPGKCTEMYGRLRKVHGDPRAGTAVGIKLGGA